MIKKIADIGLGFGAASAVPATPSFALTAGTISAVVAITGDSGATHTVLYKTEGDSAWTTGGTRSGDGNVTVSSLANGVRYIFTVYSQIDSGPVSNYAAAQVLLLAATSGGMVEDFADLLTDTAADFLLFAENIKYIPQGGGARNIQAIVDRESPGPIGDAAYGNSPTLKITVINSDTTGISTSEINCGGDKAELAVRYGETPQQRLIKKILSQDAGMMTIEVR